MALATTTPPFINVHHPLSPYPHNHAFHFPSVHQPHYAYPKLITCHAKFSGAFGDEANDINEAFFEGDDELIEDESDEEDDTESSIDLLLRFLGSMFKKVSKRARKASRSILPDVISPQLVSFAVDGLLLLASLSILKALLELLTTSNQGVTDLTRMELRMAGLDQYRNYNICGASPSFLLYINSPDLNFFKH